jgi:hypothetical protein
LLKLRGGHGGKNSNGLVPPDRNRRFGRASLPAGAGGPSDEYAYADRIFGDAARWLRSSPFVPALLALGFASGFIHYLLDRANFRFSPDVRQAARGLLQSRPFHQWRPPPAIKRE